MNQYGQRALDHSRQHRPVAYSQIPDPETFFDAIGEEVAAEVTHLRDEMLGPIGTDETPEAYRLRSYQALAIAEELILADHHLFQADPGMEADEDWSDDPDLDRRYRTLAEINQTINAPL
ncbi:MAG: hypothetical protein V9E99_05350 [Microthrixaceae bacterium]|jgi:hypothetical protein